MDRVFRWALVVAVVMGVQVALSSVSDAYAAINLDSPPVIVDNFAAPETGLSAEAQRAVWLAGISGERSAIHNMQGWRVGTMVLLAIAAALVAIQAFRLRFSEHAAELAHMLGHFATAAAIIRTIDGAQNLVITRVMAAEVSTALIAQNLKDAELAASMLRAMFATGSVMRSLLVVAVFVALSSFFRSERLAKLLASSSN
jgi:hypothetical protein